MDAANIGNAPPVHIPCRSRRRRAYFDAVRLSERRFLRALSDGYCSDIIENDNVPLATVKDGDLAVFFNHEPAGMRQLVRSLSVADAAQQNRG